MRWGVPRLGRIIAYFNLYVNPFTARPFSDSMGTLYRYAQKDLSDIFKRHRH